MAEGKRSSGKYKTHEPTTDEEKWEMVAEVAELCKTAGGALKIQSLKEHYEWFKSESVWSGGPLKGFIARDSQCDKNVYTPLPSPKVLQEIEEEMHQLAHPHPRKKGVKVVLVKEVFWPLFHKRGYFGGGKNIHPMFKKTYGETWSKGVIQCSHHLPTLDKKPSCWLTKGSSSTMAEGKEEPSGNYKTREPTTDEEKWEMVAQMAELCKTAGGALDFQSLKEHFEWFKPCMVRGSLKGFIVHSSAEKEGYCPFPSPKVLQEIEEEMHQLAHPHPTKKGFKVVLVMEDFWPLFHERGYHGGHNPTINGGEILINKMFKTTYGKTWSKGNIGGGACLPHSLPTRVPVPVCWMTPPLPKTNKKNGATGQPQKVLTPTQRHGSNAPPPSPAVAGGRKVGTKAKRDDTKQPGAKKPTMGEAQNDEEPEEDDGRAAKRPRHE